MSPEECEKEVSQVDGHEIWKLSVTGRFRIFHDSNTPSPSRDVAAGQKSQPFLSIMSYEPEVEMGDRMLGGNTQT